MDTDESRCEELLPVAGDETLAREGATKPASVNVILSELASHDLREPVHAIQGFLSLLMSGKTGPINQLQHEFLASMFTSARRLERLIKDIQVILDKDRDFSILEEDINLEDYVRSCCIELAAVFVDANLRISIDIGTAETNDPSRWRLRADPIRIEQIILNMLENALRYADPESTITVRLRSSRSRILCVVDNRTERLIEEDTSGWLISFNRGIDSTTRTPRGRGLGLTVVDHLVRLHGGRLFLRRRGHLVSVGFCLYRRSSDDNPSATSHPLNLAISPQTQPAAEPAT